MIGTPARAACIAVAALALGACASKTAQVRDPGSAAVEIGVGAVEQGNRYSFTGIPRSVPHGLIDIAVTNRGAKDHDLQLGRLDAGHSMAEFLAFLKGSEQGKPIPGWLHAHGGAAGLKPRATRHVSVSLPKGNYFYLCEVQDEDGTAHYDRGMIGRFTVAAGAERPIVAPRGPRVTVKEYVIEARSMKAGVNRIAMVNEGKELHHAIFAPLAEGKTLDDVKEFLRTQGEPAGPPPLDFEKAVSTPISDGGVTYLTELELQAGEYALLCFLTDRAGGPPHATRGMLSELDVV